jgi:hypothetical protein
MFLTRRKSAPGGRRPFRVPFRPILEALEDRVTPTGSVTVTNFTDFGGGSTLRDAVAQADANTTGVFTINLVGGTYTLSQNSPLTLTPLNLGTTIVIQGSTDPNNPTILNETGLSRVLQVSGGAGHVIITNVTVEHGKAQEAPAMLPNLAAAGGGLLNNGGNVALTNDVFQSNSAVATVVSGGGAAGGGIFTFDGILTLDTVSLIKNQAVGESGGRSLRTGGFAAGGGLAAFNSTVNVDAFPVAPGVTPGPLPVPFDTSSLTRPLLVVGENVARGGNGAAGLTSGAMPSLANGASGGTASGGGLFASGGEVSIVAAVFEENLAAGGSGGDGNTSPVPVFVGNGGSGGGAAGGGLDFVLPAGSTPPVVQSSTFFVNQAEGGNGGTGGSDLTTLAGQPNIGRGGSGGSAFGGGVGVLGATVGFQMFNSTVLENQAAGGNGGNGGNNFSPGIGPGGGGGDGGDAAGAGLDVETGTGSSTLTNVTIAANIIDSLVGTPITFTGGQNGTGGTSTVGANGPLGSLGTATGGGINSDGSAALVNSAVAQNSLAGGNTANGGPDVGGTISEATRFSYVGDPSGSNNLLTDTVLFNAANQTPNNNNAYGGFRDAQGNTVPTDPLFVSGLQLAHGGPTPTAELQAGSYLIGRGTPNAAGAALDQRGVPRGTSVDLGAVQFLGFTTAVGLTTVSATSQGVTETAAVSDTVVTGPAVGEGTVQFQLLNSVGTVLAQQSANVSNGAAGPVTLGSNLAPGNYTVTASYTDATGFFQNSAAAPQMVTVPPISPPPPPPPPPLPPPSPSPSGSPPGAPPPSPSGPPPPSLFQAILGLYIAELEKDLGFGNPAAVQQAIDFNSRFTVIFGVNIAPLIEQIADSNVASARGGGNA